MNTTYFDIDRLITDRGIVEWQQKYEYSIGDIVFFYISGKIKSIRYRGMIVATDLKETTVGLDTPYWLDKSAYLKGAGRWMVVRITGSYDGDMLGYRNLKENGLTGNLRGDTYNQPPSLFDYVEERFEDEESGYPESEGISGEYVEGAVKIITINAYERNPTARAMCLRKHGTSCKVCGMNFKDRYGDFANGFIHVHHIIPISKVGEEYIINPEEDLIPVCPNCHAMLHRKLKDGTYYGVDDLRRIIVRSELNSLRNFNK